MLSELCVRRLDSRTGEYIDETEIVSRLANHIDLHLCKLAIIVVIIVIAGIINNRVALSERGSIHLRMKSERVASSCNLFAYIKLFHVPDRLFDACAYMQDKKW